MRAVASAKNIAGAERLARDVEHTEKEIAYYLDRLDIMDETVAQGFEDKPYSGRVQSGDRLSSAPQTAPGASAAGARGQDEKVTVFGEPDARPMGYGRAPKAPSYNLQSVVDVESGLIIHHEVCNDANDSHLLHPMAVAAKEVLEVESLQVLADGGYSNAEEIARCERDHIEVAAPVKRGAMSTDHFRPAHFVYDEVATPSVARPARRYGPPASTPATEQSGIERLPAAVAPSNRNARQAPSVRSIALSIRARSIGWRSVSIRIPAS